MKQSLPILPSLSVLQVFLWFVLLGSGWSLQRGLPEWTVGADARGGGPVGVGMGPSESMEECGALSDTLFISGRIRTPKSEGLALAELLLDGDSLPAAFTEWDGYFEVNGLVAGNSYTLTPRKDTNLLNGVTTLDLALITKHILKIQPFDSPYKIIAADVNGSGTVTTADLVAIRRAILRLDEAFPIGASWRFVPADYLFPNPQNPFEPPFPDSLTFSNLAQSLSQADFIGIKLGDVNLSADPWR